jgi:hypothetical protein
MPSDHTLTELQVSDTEENEETLSIHESVPTEFRMEEQIVLVYSANKTESTGHSIIQSTNQKRVYSLHSQSFICGVFAIRKHVHTNDFLLRPKQCPFKYPTHNVATTGK